MKIVKKVLSHIFIDGLSGMASGLFATLIVGTIIQQIGIYAGGEIGSYLIIIGKVAAALTGVGIGCGVAYKFKASPLVLVSAAVTGMVGAFAGKIIAGSVWIGDRNLIQLAGPGEPLGAFVAAFVTIELGRLISGKTKIDIILTPIAGIAAGSAAGLLVGPPISRFMAALGDMIKWGVEQQPIVMGIVVAVLMGMILTLPISSAALGVVLNLTGTAAGAATVGCCANMIGFAVASYRENKVGGLVAQGLGTSMLQVPNIVKKPIIWLPAIITSAILGPIGTALHVTNNAVGSGMGTAGLIGPIMTWQTMAAERGSVTTLVLIAALYFVLPAILSYGISEGMRKAGWIKSGDMKLDM